MAWEQRPNGRSYYYRSRRCGKTVRKVYVGCGRVGEEAAKEDADRRAARFASRQAEKQRRLAFEAAQAQLAALYDVATDLLKKSFTAAGYHQHNRGSWRKKRYGKEEAKNEETGHPG